MSTEKNTKKINKYLENQLQDTEAREFKVQILRDAELLEKVFLQKLNKKVEEKAEEESELAPNEEEADEEGEPEKEDEETSDEEE